jgi:PIN domain nuclease of toxin-antitoxin system
VKIIIDTHIFLWSLAAPDRISPGNRQKIESMANAVYVSAISIAEIAIKVSLGKLEIPFDPAQQARESGYELLDFNAEAALLLMDLPFHHRDPFDRMLIAQGLVEDCHIMSDDAKFSLYDCKLIGA